MLEALMVFKQLKECLIIALVLSHYYIDKKTIFETNASDNIVITVVFQKAPKGH